MKKESRLNDDRVKTLDPGVCALVSQRDQSQFLTDLLFIFEQKLEWNLGSLGCWGFFGGRRGGDCTILFVFIKVC